MENAANLWMVLDMDSTSKFHPGHLLHSCLEEAVTSVMNFAKSVDLSEHEINLILEGRAIPNQKACIRFALALGQPHNYWIVACRIYAFNWLNETYPMLSESDTLKLLKITR